MQKRNTYYFETDCMKTKYQPAVYAGKKQHLRAPTAALNWIIHRCTVLKNIVYYRQHKKLLPILTETEILMAKHKKIAFTVIGVICASLIGLGAFLIIRHMQENTFHFTVNDTLPDGAGQKATVILLGGQSNASGCSRDDYLQKNVSKEKYAEYANGYDNVYINYLSGPKMSNGFVKCTTLQGELDGCFGPELGMAEKLHALYPDETFFIIKCAWGGTNLFDQWRSPSSSGKTGTLYKQFASYVETSIRYLESKNYDIKIEAMCWMQGESDSFSTENATNYETHLTNFIKDIRKKFARYASSDGIAFIDAYIADNPVYWVYCALVNQSKQAVADASAMNTVINTVAEGLSCAEEPKDAPDLAHYDSISQIKLGHLFAEKAAKFFD